MRILQATLVTLLVALGIASCDVFSDWKSITWNHYATGFYRSTHMVMERAGDGCLVLVIEGDPYSIHHGPIGSLLTLDDVVYAPQKRPELERIVARHGETKHESRTYEGYTQPYQTFFIPTHYFLEIPIDQIEITSDLAWGEEAPAGTSLARFFVLLSRCHDRYAKRLDDPGAQTMPEGFTVTSKSFMEMVDYAYDLTRNPIDEATHFEVILSPLSEVKFGDMDYLQPRFYLTSESPHFRESQTLTITTTFRDGTTDTTTYTID